MYARNFFFQENFVDRAWHLEAITRPTIMVTYYPVNSLAPGRSGCDYKNWIFNLVLLFGIFRSSHDNALRWMPQDLTDDKSKLVQVMAWCRQAPSHYLSQCWLSSLSPYGVARPQWVNSPWFIYVSAIRRRNIRSGRSWNAQDNSLV